MASIPKGTREAGNHSCYRCSATGRCADAERAVEAFAAAIPARSDPNRGSTVCRAPFSGRPWDVEAVAISPRLPSTLKALCNLGTPDLAIIAGENRYAWIARAVGAKWIVGHQDMPRGFHSRALDQAIPYPAEPCSQTELLALLAGDGSLPPYEKGEWPSPRFQSFSRPAEPYVLLHVGASRALKRWSPDRWRRLANALASTGCLVIWSCGPGEEELLDEIEVEGVRYAGNLDLSAVAFGGRGPGSNLSGYRNRSPGPRNRPAGLCAGGSCRCAIGR